MFLKTIHTRVGNYRKIPNDVKISLSLNYNSGTEYIQKYTENKNNHVYCIKLKFNLNFGMLL